MFIYYPLIIQSPLSGLEKLTVFALILAVFIFLFDILRSKNKKKRNSKMHKDLLYITEYKWNDLIKILTNTDNVTPSDIQNFLQIDFKKFNSKYRNILYHELFKIKKYYDVNPHNWKLLLDMIFGKKNKVKVKQYKSYDF